jgi:cell division protein FtsW (lipid II flippase)
MAITLANAINRGANILPVGFLAALGLGLLSVAFQETEWVDRAGDIVLFLVAIAAIAWYFIGLNRYRRSLFPIVLVMIALATKIVELGVEFGDPAAVGDEFGVIPVMVLILIFTVFAFRKAGAEIAGLQDEQVSDMYE